MSDDEARIDPRAETLEAILARPRAPLSGSDPELLELIRIANDLRDLPRPAFKARLAADLSRRAAMTTTTTTREGIQTVVPYLAVRPALELVEFVKRAFGAEERLRTGGAEGGMHAEVLIGDSELMIGGGQTWVGAPTPTGLHLYVPDAD